MITATAIGNLTRDPEGRSTSGNTVTNFTVAVNQKFGQNETVTFINCSFWGKRGEVFGQYHQKGDKVAVSGTLYNDKYTDRDGNERESWKMDVSNFTFVREGNNPNAGKDSIRVVDSPLPKRGSSVPPKRGEYDDDHPDIPF